MDWSYSELTLKIFTSQHAIHWLVRPAASCRTEAGCWRLWTRASWLLSSWEAWNMPGEGLRWSWVYWHFQYCSNWHGLTSTFSVNINPDNISLALLFVLPSPSSFSHSFHEMHYYFTILVILHWIMAIGFLKLCCFLWSRRHLPAQSWLCEFWFRLCFC